MGLNGHLSIMYLIYLYQKILCAHFGNTWPDVCGEQNSSKSSMYIHCTKSQFH